MGGVEEAVGDRGAGHLQPRRHLRHERHHAGLRRPPRRPRARRHLHRQHRRRRLQLRTHAGHGERAGDAVRSGVRREEVPHDGRVHAAFVDRALHVRGAAPAHVLLRGGGAAADGPIAGAGEDGGAGVGVVHPTAFLLRVPVPAAAVPAVPDEELRQRRGLRRRAVRPHPRQLAPHLAVPVRARRHRPHAQLLVVGDRRHALRVRVLRRVPRDLAGVLRRGVRRHVGLRQALLRVRGHAMLGELVLQDPHPAHWKPQERGHRGGRSLHLHDDQWVGDDDPTGILRGHRSSSGQRARREQREGREVRDDRVVDHLAGDRALLLGADHGLPQQVRSRLHLQRRRAGRRRQALRAAGLHHPAQQHPACPFRSGGWVWMAIHGGLREHRLLLPHRHTHGHPPWMAFQPWRAGDLGGHDRRHRGADAHSGDHNCPLRLGKRGHDREHAHGQAVASSVMAGETFPGVHRSSHFFFLCRRVFHHLPRSISPPNFAELHSVEGPGAQDPPTKKVTECPFMC